MKKKLFKYCNYNFYGVDVDRMYQPYSIAAGK